MSKAEEAPDETPRAAHSPRVERVLAAAVVPDAELASRVQGAMRMAVVLSEREADAQRRLTRLRRLVAANAGAMLGLLGSAAIGWTSSTMSAAAGVTVAAAALALARRWS